MPLSTTRGAFVLVRRVLEWKGSIDPVIETPPQKSACPPLEPVRMPFPRGSPESQGVPSGTISGFLAALRDDETLVPHSVLVLRNGVVLSEGAFKMHDPRIAHVTHSACKSITGLAIGMLVDEGRLSLDEPLVRIFEDRASPLARFAHQRLTVRHLLTMTCGVAFNEVGSVTATDWIGGFLEAAPLFESGSRFFYNSMDTYMLSAIVKRISGQGLSEFLRPRLWEPLGITGIDWEKCPAGIEKGGWGLYIRLEDLAKVGQLVLDGGVWNGRRLVSEHWIREATTAHIATPSGLGGFDYGYQTWVGRNRRSFLFNGLFGQNVLGFPDTGFLIVLNAGNDEMFQNSRYFQHVERWFGPSFRPTAPFPENPPALRRLRALEAGLTRAVPPGAAEFPWRRLAGRRFRPVGTEAQAVGLMPFFLQAMQNRYTKGIVALAFERTSDGPVIVVEEADQVFRLPVGFQEPRTTDLSFHGEPYRVAVSGWRETRGSEAGTLVVLVSFLETANARKLRILLRKGALIVQWTERPGRNVLVGGLEFLRSGLKDNPMLDRLVTKAGSRFLRDRIGRILEPEFRLVEVEEGLPVQ